MRKEMNSTSQLNNNNVSHASGTLNTVITSASLEETPSSSALESDVSDKVSITEKVPPTIQINVGEITL